MNRIDAIEKLNKHIARAEAESFDFVTLSVKTLRALIVDTEVVCIKCQEEIADEPVACLCNKCLGRALIA